MFLIDFMEVNRQALDSEKRVENFVGGHRLSRHDDNAPTMEIPRKLSYAEPKDAMTFSVTIPHFQMLGFNSTIAHATFFLQSLEFVPCVAKRQRVSWLELLILFEMWGGVSTDIDANRQHPALSRSSLKVELASSRIS